VHVNPTSPCRTLHPFIEEVTNEMEYASLCAIFPFPSAFLIGIRPLLLTLRPNPSSCGLTASDGGYIQAKENLRALYSYTARRGKRLLYEDNGLG
jgi:hypothetical protein